MGKDKRLKSSPFGFRIAVFLYNLTGLPLFLCTVLLLAVTIRPV